MAGLNRLQLIGRLGADPDSRSTPNGKQVCTFRVAVDRPRRGGGDKDNVTTEWFNVEAWARLAEVCQEYLSKGRLVFLEGRVQTDRYEQDGNMRYFTKMVIENMQMLDRRSSAEAQATAEVEVEKG
jgi:single-strand DNA-binding protein